MPQTRETTTYEVRRTNAGWTVGYMFTDWLGHRWRALRDFDSLAEAQEHLEILCTVQAEGQG